MIERSVFEQVTTRLARAAEQIHVGLPSDEATRMGPLQNRRQFEQVTRMIEVAEAQGARVLTGGKRPEGLPDDAQGYFIAPTVLVDVTPDMETYRDEIFGPVLQIVSAENFEEAVKLPSDHQYGNGVAIFTRNGHAAREFANRVNVGMIGVNVPIPVPMAFFSFGGWKSSLFGDLHMHGPDGVRFYTRTKVVTTRWPDRQDAVSLSMPTMK